MAKEFEDVKKPSFFYNIKTILTISFIALLIAYLILVIYPTVGSLNLFASEYSTKKNMATSGDSWKNAKSIYEFQAKDIDGNLVEMSRYKGKVLLIVNVACMCGFTAGNYPQMQELHRKYASQGLAVLAFPSNQEPMPEAEIKEFVKKYNVEFDMFSKINVNGNDAHPLYKFLKDKQSGTFGDFIKWNFSKFLVNKEGIPVKRYAPTTEPKDIEKDIIPLLNANANL